MLFLAYQVSPQFHTLTNLMKLWMISKAYSWFSNTGFIYHRIVQKWYESYRNMRAQNQNFNLPRKHDPKYGKNTKSFFFLTRVYFNFDFELFRFFNIYLWNFEWYISMCIFFPLSSYTIVWAKWVNAIDWTCFRSWKCETVFFCGKIMFLF